MLTLRFLFLCAAWDCSAWARTYALFLEERLECFRILKYDIESERLTKSSPGATKVSGITFSSLKSDFIVDDCYIYLIIIGT